MDQRSPRKRTKDGTRGDMARADSRLTINDVIVSGLLRGELDELFDLVSHLALQ